MKNRITKIISILLVCLTVGAMAASCGGDPVTTENETTAKETTETTAKETEKDTSDTETEPVTDTVTETETEPQTETEKETETEPETETETEKETETEPETETETETEIETETSHTHAFGEWKVTKQPTCTEKGSEERRCEGCNEIEIRDVAATGHKAVTDKAEAATCTKDGKTEGSHCSVCGAVLKAQTTIKAKGHTFGAWVVTREATETKDGIETRTCTVCGVNETRTLKYTGEKTAKPEILGLTMTAGDRVLIYGSAEPGSIIRTELGGSKMENKSKDKYFYIEMGIGSVSELKVTAQAGGKAESDVVKTTVNPSTLPGGGNVWGGRDSRLFYMPTINFLISNRADSGVMNSLNSQVGYITNKTIKDIQSLTGKKTKLIYVVIPDPATAYYQEHFPYVQNSVQDPSTSYMEAFLTAVNGKNSDVYGIDLMPTMRAHKDEFIYFSTDTHYTELGAYYAYLEIMKTVRKDNPGVKIRTVENGDYTVEYKDVPGGDMCGMAGIGMNEIVPFFVANFSDTGSYYVSKRNDGIKSAGFGPSNWQRDSSINSSNPTAYFLADSYGCYILPFIGANFSKVWTNEGVLWNYRLDRNILQTNKPDYVILLICQRNIGGNFMGNVISEFSMSLS